METHINTYRLNQGNKEYILTISTVNDSIRISCKKNTDDNASDFSRDFTIADLQKLDNIFNIIKTPYEALNYIDKALKIQKVGVIEEEDKIKINFYVTTKGVVHQLEIPLGESGTNLNNVISSGNTQYVKKTTTTTTTNSNIVNLDGKIRESRPYIGPVIDDVESYLKKLNASNNAATSTTTYQQTNTVDTTGFDTNTQYLGGNNDLGVVGAVDTGFQETTDAAQYLTSGETTDNYYQNLENVPLSTDITSNLQTATNQYTDNTTQYTTGTQDILSQYTTGVDTTAQYTTGVDTTAQYTADIGTTAQYTTGADTTTTTTTTTTTDTPLYTTNVENLEDFISKFTAGAQDVTTQLPNVDVGQTTTIENTATQFTNTVPDTTTQYNQYETTTPLNINNNDYLNTYKSTQTTTKTTNQFLPTSDPFAKPYITPADPLDDYNKVLRPSQQKTNQFFQKTQTTTTTTRKAPETKTKTTTTKVFSLPLHLVREEPKPIIKVVSQSDERITKLVGDTSNLKNEHQLIQDKLNDLYGQINAYKNQLALMQRQKDDNEVDNLRAENRAIKQQLAELNALRNEAAEVRLLRNQLSELDPLRRKVAEMDVLKAQLNELNTLKQKLRELGDVNSQLDELNNLRAQVSQMNVLKDQLNELNNLKARLAELSGVPSQLGELNNLRNQVSQINVLKQQIEELSNMKSNAIDADNLRRKINELENLKSQYEEEIRRLRESQRRTETVEQNKVIEFKKSEIKMRNTGMDSKQLFFEDKPQQICVKGDIIHNTDELEFLTRKINKLNQRLTLNLLYKATADSDKASAFHNKCDDARSTLVLVETDKGKRFGGFTTCSWKGDCIEKKDEDAFVFSLDKMQIYENIPGEDAIGCYPKFGAIFLGCQIRIFDNAFSKGGTTFEKGLNFNTEEDYELTGGDRTFNIKDIEVYEVIPQ